MRAEVAVVAFDLFARRGFDHTTVDDIARAAGMSRTSFFRYFPTKEDVVLGHLEELGGLIEATVKARPCGEDPWLGLRAGFQAAYESSGSSPVRALSLGRMLAETPSLKARQVEKQARWQNLLVPEVARRLGLADDPADPRPRALVAAALGCLDAAFQAWATTDGEVGMPAFIDRAMDVVTTRS
ncbi:TetR family transcriptional regulator [Umezawaea tangerina]|uniref:TetR family transcriptional regulator n=2 Tax=Umezawaea tangerina TaxID=84725 RepID=A0A2T0SLF0_9PSEU|nr:TetR family transcriptional regulator [Umezawaea tangerina]